MENARIAEVFSKIADLLELQQDNPFRVRSYRSAARTISDMSQPLDEMVTSGADLTALPNVGKAIAEKIKEIVERGTCKRLEELQAEIPEEVIQLLRVPQLGPRKAALLHRELGVRNLEDLRKAAEQGKIRSLRGMGVKTEQGILEELNNLDTTSQRFLYHVARDYVRSLGKVLDGIESVKQWEVAGSFRRGKESVGDLDVIVLAQDRSDAQQKLLAYDSITEVMSRGMEKMSVRLAGGLQVDIRFFEPGSFGAALAYFTGSKAHNIALRKRAQSREWKLNEYGLFEGENKIAGTTEESVYHCLDLPWIPPELREDRGELFAAEKGELPSLIELSDIRGDLHVHTDLTDGRDSLEDMVHAAVERGYRYLAITEHSKAVTVAKGLDEDKLQRHAARIRELNEGFKDFWLMAGVEVDILKNGKLDLDEKVLAEMDWVVASVHSHFRLDEKAMTERLIAAVNSGVTHCLGHPLSRLIDSRGPINFDWDRLLAACLDHDVCMEVNAQPDRLDLPDIYCQSVRDSGVKLAVSSDAHSAMELDFMRYGIVVARRGWVEKKHVLNTLTPKQLHKLLARK
jgi:DNA polymerase (family 10)